MSVGVIIGLASSTAHSAFTIVEADKPAPTIEKSYKDSSKSAPLNPVKVAPPKPIFFAVQSNYDRLFIEGELPKTMLEHKTVSQGMPLSLAVKLIENNGWRINATDGLNKKVQWDSSSDWLSVLSKIAGQANIYFELDVKSKTIKSSAAPKYRYYTLRKGKSLQTELSRWAKESGWVLIYDLDYDLSIVSDTKFYGEFGDVVKNQLIPAYKANGVMGDVDPITSYQNNTLKIKKYEVQ